MRQENVGMRTCPCCLRGIDKGGIGKFCPHCGVHKENFSRRLPPTRWSPYERRELVFLAVALRKLKAKKFAQGISYGQNFQETKELDS
jgi:hypothetical protein